MLGTFFDKGTEGFLRTGYGERVYRLIAARTRAHSAVVLDYACCYPKLFEGVTAQLSEPKFEPPEGDPLDVALLDMDDDAPVQGKDVKLLRDVTSSAIAQVWSDSCAASALLSQKINEGNAIIAQQLNEPFAIVGQRLDTIPTVAMLQQDFGSAVGIGAIEISDCGAATAE
ncbi:hypothetical protein Q1695_009528 [Nippostrongylus brasiliensis]|nr:hypothetical protein Q1695_009528 [Nippostrongylus brasiliensis]